MSTPTRNLAERPPLTPNTNLARNEPLTPFGTAKTSQSRRTIRHEFSFPTFHPHLDSSESIPSAHASIYDASVINRSTENFTNRSNENVDNTSNDHLGTVNILPHDIEPQSNPDHEEERRAADEFAWSNCVSTVHSPHRLEPITERNSLATLQTKASRASCKANGAKLPVEKSSQATLQSHRRQSNRSLRPQPSASTLLDIPSIQPTHCKSFSLPSFTRRSNKSSSSSVTLTSGNYLNALPRIPKRPPPERRPTPPGLPTFNTPAAIEYRLPAPPTRFRDHFRSTKATEEYRRQTKALPRGVVMRGDNGELIRGRWEPVPSGHGVNGQHPWIAAEETANMMRYPGHDGSARVRSGGPTTNLQPQQQKRKDKGERWWRKLAWICCGIPQHEDGEVRMRSVRSRAVTPAPLFVGATNTSIPRVDVGA